MSPNLHDLDGPLRFGDAKQIAAVQAFEAGRMACPRCGVLMEWKPEDGELGNAYCWRCGRWMECFICGHWLETPAELDDRMCELCRLDRVKGRQAS